MIRGRPNRVRRRVDRFILTALLEGSASERVRLIYGCSGRAAAASISNVCATSAICAPHCSALKSSVEGVALPRSSATSNLLSAKAIETTRCARYSGGFNPRNSSIRMRRRALVVRSISSCRRRANDFIEWSSVSSSNRSSTHVSAHDRTVWTTPMSIHHRPYCPFIALHVARVRLLSVVSFSKIWAPASDTLFPVAAVRSLLRYRRLSGRIASS